MIEFKIDLELVPEWVWWTVGCFIWLFISWISWRLTMWIVSYPKTITDVFDQEGMAVLGLVCLFFNLPILFLAIIQRFLLPSIIAFLLIGLKKKE